MISVIDRRILLKQFKHYKDLIRYAVRRAIHRIDVLKPEAHVEELAEHLKRSDWLGWAKQKLGRMR